MGKNVALLPPMVERNSSLNSLEFSLLRRLLFPTPEFPSRTTRRTYTVSSTLNWEA
jgi:hypothetical protein